LIRLKLAETLGQSYAWIQENISSQELDLWYHYWTYQTMVRDGIPTGGAKPIQEQEKALERVARAFGTTEIKTRPKGT